MKQLNFQTDVLPLKNKLYRLALRITLNHEDAQDIVQDTLIKVWNKRESLQLIESVEAYSLAICRNMALDAMRKHSVQTESLGESVEQHQTDSGLSPYEKMLLSDRLKLVNDIINSLPERQKSCMQLRDIECKSYKEIAAILNISEEQVKVNIYRGRQTVKNKVKTLEQYGL